MNLVHLKVRYFMCVCVCLLEDGRCYLKGQKCSVSTGTRALLGQMDLLSWCSEFSPSPLLNMEKPLLFTTSAGSLFFLSDLAQLMSSDCYF